LKLDHISYSAIKTWYDCPYLFKLKEIDKVVPSGGSIHTAFGRGIHKVCESLLQTPLSETDLWNVFLKEFKLSLQEIPTLKEIIGDKENKKLIVDMKQQARDIFPEILPAIEKYFGEYKVLSTELQLLESIPGSDMKFKGFVDLILYTPKDNKYHIVDHKSCSWGWDAEKKSDKIIGYQLALYKKFFSMANDINPENIETHFSLLKRTAKKDKHVELFRITSGKKKISNATEWFQLPLKNIEKGFYLKKTSHCAGCQAREICLSQNKKEG
jgi:hypothetical protein